jgi:hypothetical protein
MRGAISPLPLYVFMAWCLVKQRDNFTLYYTVNRQNTFSVLWLLPLAVYSFSLFILLSFVLFSLYVSVLLYFFLSCSLSTF